jgi:serine/threonine-protein kinase SRPK3
MRMVRKKKNNVINPTLPNLSNVFTLGALLYTNSHFTPTTLQAILRRLEAVDEDEILGTAAFLRRCLSLDPKLRPSAQELLKDSWLL